MGMPGMGLNGMLALELGGDLCQRLGLGIRWYGGDAVGYEGS